MGNSNMNNHECHEGGITNLLEAVEKDKEQYGCGSILEKAKLQYKELQEARKSGMKQDIKNVKMHIAPDKFKELRSVIDEAKKHKAPFRDSAAEEFSVLLTYLPPNQNSGDTSDACTNQSQHSEAKDKPSSSTNKRKNKLVKTLPRMQMTVRRRHMKEIFSSGTTPLLNIPKEDYEKLINAEKVYKSEIKELKTRLSEMVGRKLKEGNPNIADLSDKNRPTKIGEHLGEVYDNEWTDVFEEFTNSGTDEIDTIRKLAEIIKLSLSFCEEMAENQLLLLKAKMTETMTKMTWSSDGQTFDVGDLLDKETMAYKSSTKYAKDFRKENALESVTPLCTLFKDGKLKDKYDGDDLQNTVLGRYVDKCVEITWLMCVQDPPMEFIWQSQGEPVDTSSFRCYKRNDKLVETTVWPAVLLHRGGPLVSKGYIYPVSAKNNPKK